MEFLDWLLTHHEEVRNIGLVLVGVFGAPFLVWRSIIAQKQVQVSEQSQITDRINKAVEGLGADKIVYVDDKQTTQPNLEVRLGAIYALERIAQDSPRDHIQIMEILCAYLRYNADFQFDEFDEDKHQISTPRMDIQATATVLGRRNSNQIKIERENNFRMNLNKVDLSSVELVNCDFRGAIFTKTNFQNSIFKNSKFGGANFNSSHLLNTEIIKCDFKGADFAHSKISARYYYPFEGCDLYGANFSSANLENVEDFENTEIFFQSTIGNGATKLNEELESFRARALNWKKTILSRPYFAESRQKMGLTGWPYDDD